MKAVLALAITMSVALSFYSCLSPEEKDERTARTYCSSCHIFPEPSLLSKEVWLKGVLPQMAFRMGRDYTRLSGIPENERETVMDVLPEHPMVSDEEWKAIERYYQTNAPDTLHASSRPIADTLSGFAEEIYRFSDNPMNMMVRYDSTAGKVYVASRSRLLYTLDHRLHLEDIDTLRSAVSYLTRLDDRVAMLQMGIMDPNDVPGGELVTVGPGGDRKTLIDSLKRPVYFEQADLNKDGLEDLVMCSFGNYSGDLSIYSLLGDGSYRRISLFDLPGARRVIIRDFDGNGMPDILALMAQGDEKIVLLLNQGNFDFRVTTIASFPPVYGSCYFDVADFNGDGKFDILYSNGDNADYSRSLKPYHGVRILLNNGKNEFKESWFYNMHGAIQANAADFDNDGDLDIAAIALFPDFSHHPEQGFIYFENNGSGFVPHIANLGAKGRWMSMDVGDIDRDGDADILLGALNFYDGVPDGLLEKWRSDPVSVLVLRNKSKD